MPVSDVSNISPILAEIGRLQPRTVLDLGCGMGKYGALAREVLDFTHGRFEPEDWNARIVGHEGFVKYMNPMWNLYNKVHINDFTHNFVRHQDWDLVLMIDSLEHIEKEKGTQLLDYLRMFNKNVIVSCPDGDYPQGAAFGNEFERHRAVWLKQDFINLGGRILHSGVCSVALFTRQSWNRTK